MSVEFSSKDLERLKFHFDRSVSKDDYRKYKDWYDRRIEEFASIGIDLPKIDEEDIWEDIDKEYDKKLRWKLEIIHEAQHNEETGDDEE